MAQEGPTIDWVAVDEASRDGRLMELLLTLPRARWTERDESRWTLLHVAVHDANMAALVVLIQCGLDVNARTTWQRTPAHHAAEFNQRFAPLLPVARKATLHLHHNAEQARQRSGHAT